jgi:hypothetical protein
MFSMSNICNKYGYLQTKLSRQNISLQNKKIKQLIFIYKVILF